MESTTNLSAAGITAFIDGALQNEPSKAVRDFVSSSERDEDFTGFNNAGKIHKARIPKGGTMEDNKPSTEESPARKGNLIEAPERVSPGKDRIKGGDILYTTKNTIEAVKEFSGHENKEQSSSYDTQHTHAPLVHQLSVSTGAHCDSTNENNTVIEHTGAHCDSTNENNTVIEQPQWRLSEVKPAIEDCRFQTREAYFQVSTQKREMDSPRDAFMGCRKWTIPVNAERRVDEHEEDLVCAHGSNRISPLNDLAFYLAETRGNILDDASQTEMRDIRNYEDHTHGGVCPTGGDIGNSSGLTGKTETSTIFAANHSIAAACTLSTSGVSLSAASLDTGKNDTTSTPKVKISAASIETDKTCRLSAPDVYISATAIETDNSSTISARKVDISPHLVGDSTDLIHAQRNEIKDCPDMKISEISPDVNDTGKIRLMENTANTTRSCCSQTLVSNYLSNDANTFVNSGNEEPGDYTMENALFLVRSYISELEKVATNIERILQSDSSRLEISTRCNNRKVSDLYAEFEGNIQSDTKGDNLEMIAGNISIELSDPLGEDMPKAFVKTADVNGNIVGLGEGCLNRNEECKLEYVSPTRGEIPAESLARCDAPKSGLPGDQTICLSVSSNSETEDYAYDLHPHNVNNNSAHYVSANIGNNNNNNTWYVNANCDNNNKHVLLAVNANEQYQQLSQNRTMRCIFSPVCTDTRNVKCHRRYIRLKVNTRFNRVDTNYANINNNGNTISPTSRNITLSSEPTGVPDAQMHTEHDGLKTRNQHFRNKLTTPGCDILVFEGSKVYSVTQKASNAKELVGTYVSDASESKPNHNSSDNSHSGLASSAYTPLHGCETGNTFSEINAGLAMQCEKSGEQQDAREISQARSNFDTRTLTISDALRLPENEKVQSAQDVYLNNNNGDDRESQTSYSESKQNHAENVVPDNVEMLKVDTMASSNYQNIIHGCELQPVRIMKYEAEQTLQNAKRAKTTKRSRSKSYMDNKHQYRKGKCAGDSSLLDIVSAAQCGVINTNGKTERDSSPLPFSCKQCYQTSVTTTLHQDNRWASALGRNENRSTGMTKIEYPKKRNFPMRIRAASKQSQKDVYIPARTRRLTVESPAENLLVHTSYDRPNPKQLADVINIEMANRSNVLYLGAEEDHINTDGTRRLVCETECLSSKDPKTKHLVIENRALNISYGNIHPASDETKTKWENDISVAADEITRARRELPEAVRNVSDKSIKWCGVNCARMIGDFVVIGTTKSIQSVVNMVHKQIKYSIPAGVNCEASDLPGAGDVGHSVPRKVAVCDRRGGGGEAGDHLPMAITDNDFSNSNNNNVCMRDTIIGCSHIQRLHHKGQGPRHGGRRRNMASYVNRMGFSSFKPSDGLIFATQTNFILESHAVVKIYKVIKIIYQLRNKTMRIVHCRFCGLLLSRRSLATISYEPNRNNSSARENYDFWDGNKSGVRRSTDEASTGTTDLNSEDVLFVKDCESWLLCSSCSNSDQVTQQDKHVKLRDFMTQVAATDINPTTESQTGDVLQAPSDTRLRLRNSAARLSLVDVDIHFRRHKKVSCRNCNSCCELRTGVLEVEPPNQEIDTQVHATDINPSNLAQTGTSLTTIASRLSSLEEANKYWRAVTSNISLHLLHYEPDSEADHIDIFVTKSLEQTSLWTYNDSEHPRYLSVIPSDSTMNSFQSEQHASSYHNHEHTQFTDPADEHAVGTITHRGLSGLEMQEAGLIWKNNSFVPQQDLGLTLSGPDLSVYGHLKSELEFFMNDEDVFGGHRNGSQRNTSSTNYVPNNVDHESGGYRIASIPTSRMSLTVVNPAPVYDFTFTKDHWQAKYKHRTGSGNSSQDRDVEEADDSDEAEDQARDHTVKDIEEVATVVGCKRQRSEDQNLRRAKSSTHRRFIIY